MKTFFCSHSFKDITVGPRLTGIICLRYRPVLALLIIVVNHIVAMQILTSNWTLSNHSSSSCAQPWGLQLTVIWGDNYAPCYLYNARQHQLANLDVFQNGCYRWLLWESSRRCQMQTHVWSSCSLFEGHVGLMFNIVTKKLVIRVDSEMNVSFER